MWNLSGAGGCPAGRLAPADWGDLAKSRQMINEDDCTVMGSLCQIKKYNGIWIIYSLAFFTEKIWSFWHKKEWFYLRQATLPSGPRFLQWECECPITVAGFFWGMLFFKVDTNTFLWSWLLVLKLQKFVKLWSSFANPDLRALQPWIVARWCSFWVGWVILRQRVSKLSDGPGLSAQFQELSHRQIPWHVLPEVRRQKWTIIQQI